MADIFSRRISKLDISQPPRCLQCDRVLSPHGEYLACPCCGEIYMYFVKYIGTETPNQNGWVHTVMSKGDRNPNIWTVIGRHSCRAGNMQEDAKSVWYVNAEGKRIRRRKTPREQKIDREVKYAQGTFTDFEEG